MPTGCEVCGAADSVSTLRVRVMQGPLAGDRQITLCPEDEEALLHDEVKLGGAQVLVVYEEAK